MKFLFFWILKHESVFVFSMPSTANPDKSPEDALANLLKNPLLNPALLSLNPSLYAVQLAQLQAALAAQTAGLQQPQQPKPEAETNLRKRKLEDESAINLSSSRLTPSPANFKQKRAESPLDLSGCSKGLGGLEMHRNAAPETEKFSPAHWAAAAAAAAGGAYSMFNPFLHSETLSKMAAKSPVSPSISSSLMSSSPPMSERSGSNPLDRMSEIAKTGGAKSSAMNGHRTSAWQSQWLNRAPDANKDIFKCVCCADSFGSLQDLTIHMKETGHYAPQARSAALKASPARSPVSPPFSPYSKPSPPPPQSPKRDLLKEQLPVPRKLVRGQDVWLGKGEQQTKDILKCMYCGESFRTLEMLTSHMQETKHYTKVISQEQLSNWSGPPGSAGSSNGGSPHPRSASNNEQINAVLSCKVCSEAFSSLKQLSDHIVKHNHYGAGAPSTSPNESKSLKSSASFLARREEKAANSKKSKSLPVKTLLEMERNRQFQQLQQHKHHQMESPCVKCGESVPLTSFLSHTLGCDGGQKTTTALSTSPGPSRSDSVNSLGDKRPESAKSASSSSIDDAKSVRSNKSILGSLEDMVQHNFRKSADAEKTEQSVSRTASPSSPKLSSPSPARASPTSPLSATSLKKEASSPFASLSIIGKDTDVKESKSKSGNPLAALQQLCESTEQPPTGVSAVKESPKPFSDPGSMLAFSWACNQAVVNDSVFKCPFCDTPFISKGAYRHHLSKVHFMKDGAPPSLATATANNNGSEAKKGGEGSAESPKSEEKEGDKEDENKTENKYHKYAELARQLSTKPVSSPAWEKSDDKLIFESNLLFQTPPLPIVEQNTISCALVSEL